MLLRLATLFVFIWTASALTVPRQFNDGVHLAVSPNCGTLGGSPADINVGLLPLKSYKTIVVFGDAYSSNGVDDGSTASYPIVIPPSPMAGGRMSDGPVWTEYLASDAGATLKNYAVDGAFADKYQWPGGSDGSDSSSQVNVFNSQGNNLDPDTTLYIAFFGIDDYAVGNSSGDLPFAAETVIYNLAVLASSPTFAKNILIVDNHGLGTNTNDGTSYRQNLYDGLTGLHDKIGASVGFVDFSTIWDGVLDGPPGYSAFGYTNPGACTTSASSMIPMCLDPLTSFYWIPGYPSTQTHRIMATYVEQVLTQCST